MGGGGGERGLKAHYGKLHVLHVSTTDGLSIFGAAVWWYSVKYRGAKKGVKM